MSLMDGPGIRTTVFLKGCSLNCPWCSNPENISLGVEYWIDQEKCLKEICRYKEECGLYLNNKNTLDADYSKCYADAITKCGHYYSVDELYKELMKDYEFWGSTGGVTFSGGEALLQMEKLIPLCKALKERDVHLTMETALFVPLERVKEACQFMDLFYIDVKLLDPILCKEVLNGDIKLYDTNVKYVIEKEKNIIFRFPCTDQYFFTPQNMQYIKAFVVDKHHIPMEFFDIHNLGEKKYELIRKRFQHFDKSIYLDSFIEELVSEGYQAKRIRI